MPEFLLVGDLHLADHPPSSCTSTYTDDLFDLLEQTVELTLDRRCEAVVWAGDVVHLKQPSRTSHRLVQRIIRMVEAYPCPVYIVPGNHDLVHDRLDSLSMQPLGVILTGKAQLLMGQALDHPVLYGVPWLQRFNDHSVEAVLTDYRAFQSASLVVAHAPLYPPGLELPYEFYPTEQWAKAMGGRGYCYYGHPHPSHGIYQVGGVTFCNHGSLSRGSLHESELTREIAVTAWDSETGRFERIPLAHKPASEVFRLAETEEKETVQMSLDAFLDSIKEATIEVTSIESIIEYIRQLGLGDEVEALVSDLLVGAQNG